MKRKLLYSLTVAAILAAFGAHLYAQTEIIFDPSLLKPDTTGYYYAGYDKEISPGVFEHFDSCTQEAQGSHHFETGEQNGYHYEGAVVMPTCPSKNLPSDVSLGYVQLKKAESLVSFNTDTASLGQIISPPIENLTQLYVEFSPDVTPNINSGTYVIAWIQYSINDGVNWDTIVFIQYQMPDGGTGKDGDVVTYDDTDFAFQEMATASQAGPIRLKIVAAKPKNDLSARPQRMRVHKVIITATPVGINDVWIVDKKPFYTISGNRIIATGKPIEVFNILGQRMGSGESVTVKTGIYIVKAADGRAKKVYVNENVK